MKDVLPGLVQVQRDRLPDEEFRRLKKEIAWLDREIQKLQIDISRCDCNLAMLSSDSQFIEKWSKRRAKQQQWRDALDATRKTTRAQLKRYEQPNTSQTASQQRCIAPNQNGEDLRAG